MTFDCVEKECLRVPVCKLAVFARELIEFQGSAEHKKTSPPKLPVHGNKAYFRRHSGFSDGRKSLNNKQPRHRLHEPGLLLYPAKNNRLVAAGYCLRDAAKFSFMLR